jgi:hypothetical protein
MAGDRAVDTAAEMSRAASGLNAAALGWEQGATENSRVTRVETNANTRYRQRTSALGESTEPDGSLNTNAVEPGSWSFSSRYPVVVGADGENTSILTNLLPRDSVTRPRNQLGSLV